VNLRIRPESVDEEGTCLHFIVEDTGIGIPLEKQAHIFEAFAQVDGSTARRYGGTGLGLSISREIVRLMRGRIWVESQLNRGSAFHFTARFGTSRPAAFGAPSEIPGATSQESAGEARTLHILLAEDNSVNRKLASVLLEKRGHSVVTAANGRQVLERLRQDSFDLILMDLQMPGMDGLAATRAIRDGAGPNRGTPSVALSANVLSQHLDACREAGMNDHIGKPINAAELLTKVAHWTSQAEAKAIAAQA